MKPEVLVHLWSLDEVPGGWEVRRGQRDTAYVLDEFAVSLWRRADGTRTVQELIDALSPHRPQAVWDVLDEFADAGLLKERLSPPSSRRATHCRPVYSRRDALGKMAAGLAAGVSVGVFWNASTQAHDHPPEGERSKVAEQETKATERHYKNRVQIEAKCKRHVAEDRAAGETDLPSCSPTEDRVQIRNRERYIKRSVRRKQARRKQQAADRKKRQQQESSQKR